MEFSNRLSSLLVHRGVKHVGSAVIRAGRKQRVTWVAANAAYCLLVILERLKKEKKRKEGERYCGDD